MLLVKKTSQFKTDYKKVQRSGRHDMQALKTVMEKIRNQESLEEKYHDHPLKGEHQDLRDCHIEGDWLLLYRIDGDTVVFIRLGTHSELFG